MNAKSKLGSLVQPSFTHGIGKPESTYIPNPQRSLHEIVIYTSQIEQGEIGLSDYFEGGWKRLAYFSESGISRWAMYFFFFLIYFYPGKDTRAYQPVRLKVKPRRQVI